MKYWLSYDWGGRVRQVHADRLAAVQTTANRVTQHDVPEDWAMYTKAGDRSLTAKAVRFVHKLMLGPPGVAFATFFRAVRKMYLTKTLAEASDTAVRESVLGFAMRFKDLVGGEDKAYAFWDKEGCS